MSQVQSEGSGIVGTGKVLKSFVVTVDAAVLGLAGLLCNGFFERQVILGMGAVNNYVWIALGFAEAVRKWDIL